MLSRKRSEVGQFPAGRAARYWNALRYSAPGCWASLGKVLWPMTGLGLGRRNRGMKLSRLKPVERVCGDAMGTTEAVGLTGTKTSLVGSTPPPKMIGPLR